MGYQGVPGYTEEGQGWQGDGYGYGYYQAYAAGYQQGLSDAQAGLTYECSGHTQYYCDGYSQGFDTTWNNSQQQTQTQGAEVDVKGNSNYVGVNQEQSGGIGRSYPALREDDNGNGNGYYSSIQPVEQTPAAR